MDRTTIPPITALEPAAGTRYVGRSDVGRSRSENQDYMGVFRAGDRLLAVVADGMGGHAGGFEASRIAVDAMRSVLLESAETAPVAMLNAGLIRAHERILEAGAGSPELKKMGTTLVAVLVDKEQAWFGHVGDSRAYMLRDGALYLITLDHSRVHRMLLEGMIKAEQVADHPMGHILERSVGASAKIEPEVRSEPVALQSGDRIVLCSDGVWSVVGDEDVARLAGAASLPLAVEGLVGVALARMADDNATVVIVEATQGGPAAAALEDVRSRHGFGGPASGGSGPAKAVAPRAGGPGVQKGPALRSAPVAFNWRPVALGVVGGAVLGAALAGAALWSPTEAVPPVAVKPAKSMGNPPETEKVGKASRALGGEGNGHVQTAVAADNPPAAQQDDPKKADEADAAAKKKDNKEKPPTSDPQIR